MVDDIPTTTNPKCPLCGMRVLRPPKEDEFKLEEDFIVVSKGGNEKVTIPVSVLQCTNCANLTLFSSDKMPQDKIT
jgi:hypothetical protein